MRPFIGSWTAESDAYEGFEGNEHGGKIDMVFRFRWLQEKVAVELSSRIIHKKPEDWIAKLRRKTKTTVNDPSVLPLGQAVSLECAGTFKNRALRTG